MYKFISTEQDTMREVYLYGAELVGEYGFPKLHKIHADLTNLRPVCYNDIGKEKRPQECVAHFFTADYRFASIWSNCDKPMETLKRYKYVATPDFSVYSNMPKAMQIWNVYRDRALAWYMWSNNVNVIPTVVWSDENSFEWCFDGLPQNSTLAVSTNGCCSIRAREYYKAGFKEMCKRLNPYNVLVIGGRIDVDCDANIVQMDGYRIQNREGARQLWAAEAEHHRIKGNGEGKSKENTAERNS